MIKPDEADTAELLRKVRLALLGAARVLQYRNKMAGAALRQEQAGAFRELTRKFAVPLIINMAQQVAEDGVHLGGTGSDRLLGVSCYNRLALAVISAVFVAPYIRYAAR